MLNDLELALLQEINQRVTRTESRMVQLGDFVGTNLRVRMRVAVRKQEGAVWVEVDALDTSISRIYTELREHGIAGMAVPVRLDGKDIATVYP